MVVVDACTGHLFDLKNISTATSGKAAFACWWLNNASPDEVLRVFPSVCFVVRFEKKRRFREGNGAAIKGCLQQKPFAEIYGVSVPVPVPGSVDGAVS